MCPEKRPYICAQVDATSEVGQVREVRQSESATFSALHAYQHPHSSSGECSTGMNCTVAPLLWPVRSGKARFVSGPPLVPVVRGVSVPSCDLLCNAISITALSLRISLCLPHDWRCVGTCHQTGRDAYGLSPHRLSFVPAIDSASPVITGQDVSG